jgi:2-keto-3-deoxy-L-rhamnonate aldolase RhmA
MGIPGQFEDPRFLDALQRVAAAANSCGKAAAIQPSGFEQAEKWLALGFRALSWKTDIALYRGALQSEVKKLREMLAPPRPAAP